MDGSSQQDAGVVCKKKAEQLLPSARERKEKPQGLLQRSAGFASWGFGFRFSVFARKSSIYPPVWDLKQQHQQGGASRLLEYMFISFLLLSSCHCHFQLAHL